MYQHKIVENSVIDDVQNGADDDAGVGQGCLIRHSNQCSKDDEHLCLNCHGNQYKLDKVNVEGTQCGLGDDVNVGERQPCLDFHGNGFKMKDDITNSAKFQLEREIGIQQSFNNSSRSTRNGAASPPIKINPSTDHNDLSYPNSEPLRGDEYISQVLDDIHDVGSTCSTNNLLI